MDELKAHEEAMKLLAARMKADNNKLMALIEALSLNVLEPKRSGYLYEEFEEIASELTTAFNRIAGLDERLGAVERRQSQLEDSIRNLGIVLRRHEAELKND